MMSKHTDVIKEMNHGFGPVFRRRQNRDFILDLFVLVIFIVGIISTALLFKERIDFKVINSETNLPGLEFGGYFTALVSSVIIGDVFRRLSLYFEERNHVIGRYNGSHLKALQACFLIKDKNTSILVYGLFTLSSVVTIYYWCTSTPYISICLYISNAVISSIGKRFLGFNTLSQVEISELNEKYNTNVAEGLAYSYYYGYLKLILPPLETTIEKSCTEEHKINGNDISDILSTKKVFIIVSKNCNGYTKFVDVDDRIMYKGQLFPLHCTRGGVQNRTYVNSVYEIKLENREPEYLVLEYATPLLCMYDMAQNMNANFTMRDLEQQVTAFYLKLLEILENDYDCRGKYQLILCADVNDDLPEVICSSLDDPRVDMF